MSTKRQYIVCIADNDIRQELTDFVESIRVKNWSGKVLIYTPDNNPVKFKAKNCSVIKCKSDWINDLETTNASALLKPDIFLDKRFKDGDRVAYFDCSDIVFLCSPDQIFSLMETGFCLYAKKHLNCNISQLVPKGLIDNTDLFPDQSLRGNGVSVNSGVILSNISDKSRGYFEHWRLLVREIPKNAKSWLPKNTGKIGDQTAFSYVWRLAALKNDSSYIPEEYNYNNGYKIRKLRIINNSLISSKKKRIFIPHSSGKLPLPRPIIELSKQ